VRLLTDREWKLKYTPEDGDLTSLFYVPALSCAVHYDRSTGYFSASALALAMRGIEGLVRNEGHMRLVVGCTLDPPEIEAIEKGEALRDAVERKFASMPLAPPDSAANDALELLAWLVAHGILDVKVAIPCDEDRRPIPSDGIFHAKAGILRDKAGNRLAFVGSINETEAGWRRNWEEFHVFTSWGGDGKRVDGEAEDFERIWKGDFKRLITLDVPDAARQDLLRFLPKDDRPARLKPASKPEPKPPPEPPTPEPIDLRRRVWAFIREASRMPDGGERVGEATCAVEPWPHQVRAFDRMYRMEAPRLLIADEVGLGKTIQAGMLIRQMWLAGRAKRILILAPAAVMRQWQIELREKFNLNWPVYDGGKLHWYPSPGLRGRESRPVSRDEWHREPAVIASSHLMRRRDRQAEVCDAADPWDLVVLDEAHHARRRGAGSAAEGGPNALLRLMQKLRHRTNGLVLLTATPMQVHAVEVWDLLNLLGLPPEWDASSFLRYFEVLEKPSPSHAELDQLARMFRAVERDYGETPVEAVQACGVSRLRARRILSALRDPSSIPRRQLETDDRKAALKLLKRSTPVAKLISRHTRDLLRAYYKAGRISTPIAERQVDDRFIEMSDEEWRVYRAVEDYISTVYNRAAPDKRNAVGFVMTVYRRRVASSFRALANTLHARLKPLVDYPELKFAVSEDASDDESRDEVMDADEVLGLEREAAKAEERAEIERLLDEVRQLPVDTKASELKRVLRELRDAGYRQVMVFSQYTDTMDFLRDELRGEGYTGIVCFSGRGGEVLGTDGRWHTVSRDDVKRRFRDGQAEILLCTDAAAEGLNFQFCGALVNYDMPWNPMRVEQRIGRIDRLGQQHTVVRVVNLHYRGTVESDVYLALRTRIGLFEAVVGKLQPILARLPSRISGTVLQPGEAARDRARKEIVEELESEVERTRQEGGFDLDQSVQAALEEMIRPEPPLDLDLLDRVIRRPDLLPPGVEVNPLGPREYAYTAPGMPELRVTTDARFFEQHPESVELWSPGGVVFPSPDDVSQGESADLRAKLSALLARV